MIVIRVALLHLDLVSLALDRKPSGWSKTSTRCMCKLNKELKIPMSHTKLKPISTKTRQSFNLRI